MPDVNWHDCIKSHHKGLRQVKICFRTEKKSRKEKKRKSKEKKIRKEKDKTEKNRKKKVNIIDRIVLDKFRLV